MCVRYLFVDFNAYFASVEQQERPELRGRPVVVVPVDADTTSCIAASYEAKTYGIRTGTRVADAKAACPGLVVIVARGQAYIRMHHQLVAAVDSVVPVEKVYSIDEMVCPLRGREQQPAVAEAVAKRVRDAIYAVGDHMHCSIGIGPNRLLAKVASDMKKPRGLTVIRSDELPGRLRELKLDDFPGVAKRMLDRLHRHGVYTAAQFCQLDAPQLAAVWGSKVLGDRWWAILQGHDVADTPTKRSTLGHSRVLSPGQRTEAEAKAVLTRLVHKAGVRLRHVGYWAQRVTVTVSHVGQRGWSAQQKIEPAQDTLTLVRTVGRLWDGKPGGAPAKVGVVLGDLQHARSVTRSLFDPDHHLVDLARAMDRIGRAHGEHAVYTGGMHGQAKRSVTRIAFGVVPDEELFDV